MEKNKLIEWAFPEYGQYERSRGWYIAMIILLSGLGVYAILTGNFLFAIILVLAVFIAVFQRFQPPLSVSVQITDKGLQVGRKYIPFRDISKFWLIYNPPESKFLYVSFNHGLRGDLAIPLEEVNPLELREILKGFLEEDLSREEDDLNEALRKLMKI